MKRHFFSKASMVATVLLSGLVMTSCYKEEDEQISATALSELAAKPVEVLSGLYTTDYHMTSNADYKIDGKVVFVNGAKLTIDAGTLVMGVAKDDPKAASAIVITKGSKIIAQGTENNPIVMTAENGRKGGWGGLVILGKATVNQGTDQLIEGIDKSIEQDFPNVDFTYGGNEDADNSGVLRYVRVEYAGAAIAKDNELNAFTFGGVGSGTTLEYLQAYHGADDAFEFFGGTVNAKYLISTAAGDDAFDFDFGYTGSLQFLICTIDPEMSYSNDPNGIECDNDLVGSNNVPITHPKISNLTVVGTIDGRAATPLKSAANFRRNTQFTLVNSVLYGFPTGILNETQNTYIFKNNVVNGIDAIYSPGFAADASNVAVQNPLQIGLLLPFVDAYSSIHSLKPISKFTRLGADFTGLGSFFTPTEYKGAIDPNGIKWTVGKWVKK